MVGKRLADFRLNLHLYPHFQVVFIISGIESFIVLRMKEKMPVSTPFTDGNTETRDANFEGFAVNALFRTNGLGRLVNHLGGIFR